MSPDAPKTSPSSRAGSSSEHPKLGLRRFIRAALPWGLYHSGLLSGLKRLAHRHSLGNVPGSRLPRLRRTAASKFGILCYHRVGDRGIPLFSRLNPETFKAQMRYLKRHYRLVPLSQLCRELQDGVSAEPTLAITFDDGYRDLYSYAFPVLREYQIPATVYLIGQAMETGEAPWYDRMFVALHSAVNTEVEVDLETSRRFSLSSPDSRMAAAWEIICYLRTIPNERRRAWCADFERRVPVPESLVSDSFLTWEQVREMQRHGVSFGAHTMSHPSVSRLDPATFPEELGRTKRLLENGLNAAVEDFAYPFGKPADMSRDAEVFLRDGGYRSAVTTIEGYNTTGVNPFELHRLQIGDGRSLAEFSFGIGRMFLEGASTPTPQSEGQIRREDAAIRQAVRREA